MSSPSTKSRMLWRASLLLSLFSFPALGQSERTAELAREQPAEREKTSAVVSAGDRGFSIKSADGAFQLRLRGLIQADGRASLFQPQPQVDTFLLRRVRPSFEATAFDFVELRIMPDFGQGAFVLYDASADLRLRKWLTLRVGKFKPELGLERLQSDANVRFIERSHVSSIAPTRDTGVQLAADLARSALVASVGLFNGVVDGGLADTDNNQAKDLVGRVFLHPFRIVEVPALADIGLGVSVSYGRQAGSATVPNLPTFKSPGQLTYFSYLADAYASGMRTRVSPQLYAYFGNLGLISEYISSAQRVVHGTDVAVLRNQAWQQTLTWAVTGEEEGFEGLNPRNALDLSKNRWGALELAARYHALSVDPAAFPLFADSAKSAQSAQSFGLGINWYLNRNVRSTLDLDRTDYVGGAVSGADRTAEYALIGRLQVSL